MTRKPDFDNLLAVLRREKPSRPTLYEFVMNERLYRRILGLDPAAPLEAKEHVPSWLLVIIRAFYAAGYDYATITSPIFQFPKGQVHRIKSKSLNEGALITDWAGFEAYPWPDPDAVDYEAYLNAMEKELAPGMKLVPWGPGGVLENVTELVGFDTMCILLYEDPELAQAVFDAVGSRLVRYYARIAPHRAVGACTSNDDWGFKTQTMLSPAQMRRYVFPWHRRIVEAIHAAGKPAILHSCGQLSAVMDDIIDDMKFDAKHSFEDAIVPVEEAYERWGSRIAILGGIDVDFVCRSTPEEITRRAKAMLERTKERGGYALGTGNSVPDYVPDENYLALIRAALEP